MAILPKSPKKDLKDFFEEIVESFLMSFLFIILFTIYRRIRGIPFTELRLQIMDGYLKFLLVFLITGTFCYVFFFLILKRRILLDIVLFIVGSIIILLFIGFIPDDFHMHLIILLFAAILCHYFFVYRGIGKEGADLSGKAAGIILVALFGFSIFFVPQVGIMRHKVFLTSGFDLGIFDQMFYNMAQGKAPMTSIYNTPMNHMLEVHFSPIFYLILPIYMLIPSPKTLIFMQCFFVALAIFPLYHLCRVYRIQRKYALIFCVLFLVHPSVIGGEFRDFHENKMLAVFLLSFLYFCERKPCKYGWGIFFLFLTLMVREDAPIYIITYSIYRFFDRKEERKQSLLLLFIALAYYFAVTKLLIHMDIFSYRYKAILPPGDNQPFFNLVKILFTNPIYILMQSLTAEKIKFLSLLLLPLLLIPLTGLFSIKKSFLFIPFIGLAVLQDIFWQNVNVQYYYGIICFFFLITILFFDSLPDLKKKNFLLATMVFSTLIFSISSHIGKAAFFKYWEKDHVFYQQMEADLRLIPQEASVTASNHIFPHLSQREEIYLHYFEGRNTDIIVIDLRDDKLRIPPEKISQFLSDEMDYGVFKFQPDWYLIIERGQERNLNQQVIGYLSYKK